MRGRIDFVMPTDPEEWGNATEYLRLADLDLLLTPIPLSLPSVLIRPLDAYNLSQDDLSRHLAQRPLVVLDPYQPRADGLRSPRGMLHPTLARRMAEQGSIILFTLQRCLGSWEALSVCRMSLRIALKRKVRVALVTGAARPEELRARKDLTAVPIMLGLPPSILGEDVLGELAKRIPGRGFSKPRA